MLNSLHASSGSLFVVKGHPLNSKPVTRLVIGPCASQQEALDTYAWLGSTDGGVGFALREAERVRHGVPPLS